MPIYEYRCESCGEEMEMIQKISDPPLTQCPQCKAESLQKKTSMSAFHLKGGGWYKDGYGGEKSTKEETKKDTVAVPAAATPEKPKDTAAKTTTTETKTPKSETKPAPKAS